MIVCVGYLNIEDTIYPNRSPVEQAPGGAALYFATAARLWQAEVSLVSRVGEDYPSQYLSALKASGINIEGVTTLPGPTMAGRTAYDAEGARKYTMYTPLPRRLELTPLPSDWHPQGSVSAVHLATIPPHVQLAWAKVARQWTDVMSLDTDVSFVNKNRQELVEVLRNIDIFFPNETEALALFPGFPLEEIAWKISDLGPRIVVIKRGREGALIYSRNEEQFHRIPALPVQVVDVTGAGDAFAGGLIAGLIETDDLEKAGWRGAMTASLAIQGYGGLHVLQRRREEAEKLQQFREEFKQS